MWWVKLGIHPERIQRGKPTQNDRHERIHRTLQEDIVQYCNVQQRTYLQQRVFDQFRHKYNASDIRPTTGQHVVAWGAPTYSSVDA